MKLLFPAHALLAAALFSVVLLPATASIAQAPPDPWVSADIGSVGDHKGTVVYDDAEGSFRINGSGGDIWEKSDAFFYVYQYLKGDGTIIAHFRDGLEFVDPNAEAGLMIRGGLEPGAPHALLAVTSLNGIVFKRRTAPDEATAKDTVSGDFSSAAKGHGVWLKLERTGTRLAASMSDDGATWSSVGDENIDLGPNVVIGLVMTPHDNNQAFGVATFNNVKITRDAAAAPNTTAAGKKAASAPNRTAPNRTAPTPRR